jgi:hypothetical protein
VIISSGLGLELAEKGEKRDVGKDTSKIGADWKVGERLP